MSSESARAPGAARPMLPKRQTPPARPVSWSVPPIPLSSNGGQGNRAAMISRFSGLQVHRPGTWIHLVVRRLAAEPDSARFGSVRLIHSDQAQARATGRVGALGDDVHVPLPERGHRPSQWLVQESAAEHPKDTGPWRLVRAVADLRPAGGWRDNEPEPDEW